jgi:hypothetical protein
MNILTVNLLFNTLVFWIAAKLYVLPRLNDFEPSAILLPILLLHALRHLGLMFLAPGAVLTGIEGTLDLISAISLATLYNAAPLMGPAYWIPAFWVPALIVPHYIAFVILLSRWRPA